MTNEQRVRVDRLVRYLITDREKTYTTVRVNDLDTVLSLIKEQEKQIDLMAESIELQQYANIDTSNLDLVCEKLKCNKKCELVKKDCIKQYFEDKVNSSEQN